MGEKPEEWEGNEQRRMLNLWRGPIYMDMDMGKLNG
jgi:hypothetical protein